MFESWTFIHNIELSHNVTIIALFITAIFSLFLALSLSPKLDIVAARIMIVGVVCGLTFSAFAFFTPLIMKNSEVAEAFPSCTLTGDTEHGEITLIRQEWGKPRLQVFPKTDELSKKFIGTKKCATYEERGLIEIEEVAPSRIQITFTPE